VELQEEVKQLHDYIELEKLRYGKGLKVSFNVSDQIDGFHIAPLMLLPFVENSFKHGAGSEIESPFIDLLVNVKDSMLEFRIRNSYTREDDVKADNKAGIGLKNVKRRLELLYPQKHFLEIIKDSGIFEITLKLDLRNAPA
jgi:LytS/YehU family sensor histidine kinase